MIRGYIISKDKNIIDEFYKNIRQFVEIHYTYVSKEYRIDFWSYESFSLYEYLYDCVFKYYIMDNVEYCVEFKIGEEQYGR